jgi:MFS family permease
MASIATPVGSEVGWGDRRPFVGLLLAQVLSAFGNSLTAIAIPWFVLETTGSVTKTGLVAAAAVVPTIIAMAFGSAAVDRFGFRRMSIVADALSLASVAAIPAAHLTGDLSLPLLLALVFLGALFDAPGSTARSSMLPELAQRAGVSLERANGISQGVFGLATLAGPVVGGVLIGVVGASNVLWFDAVTFALSVAIIAALIPAVFPVEEPGDRSSYLDEVRDGWRLVVRDPLILRIMLVATAINFVTAPLFSVLLPAWVNGTVGEARVLGFLLAGFGAGSLVGIALYSWLGERLPRFPLCVIGIGVFALACAALAASLPWAALVGVLFVTGLVSAPVNPIVFTVIQDIVPIEFRARALGAIFATAILAAPVGLLLSGSLVAAVGLPITFVVAGIILLAVTLWMASSADLRALDSTRSGDGPSVD